MAELKPKVTPTFADQIAQNGPVVTRINGAAWAQMVNQQALQQLAGEAAAAQPVPEEQPKPEAAKPLKIALVGTAPSSRMLAPYDDPSWQIWVCSPGNMGAIPKADAWFELHENLDWPEYKNVYGDKYVAWLKTLAIPVFMQSQRLVPNAKVFPKDELVAEFGRNFFTSSFAWMMAFALKLGATEIALFGIDMASPGEYDRQRQGFYYFKERAEERGAKVWAPKESDIMIPPPLYGYAEVSPYGRKLMARWQEIKERIAQGEELVRQAEADLEQKKDFVKHLRGAAEDMEYHVTILMPVGETYFPK